MAINKSKVTTKKPIAKKTISKPIKDEMVIEKVMNKSITNNNRKSQFSKLFISSLGLLLILTTVIGIVNYKNSVKAINNYYSTNDTRRNEVVYRELKVKKLEEKIVVSNYGLINFTYSLVHENPQESKEIIVETFYLKRKNVVDFMVTKSFRTVVSGKTFDEVVKLARGRDLHIDNPDSEQKEIMSMRDLDLTPEQQNQAMEQKKAQEDQQKAQAEYEALPTDQKIAKLETQLKEIQEFIDAVKAGEKSFKGQEIPQGVDPNYLTQVLESTKAEIERLKTGAPAPATLPAQ